jgi:hypothetical protein
MKQTQELPWLQGHRARETRDLLRLKEAFLKLTPGFEQSRREYGRRIRELRAEGDLESAYAQTKEFSRRWNIPMEKNPSVDPAYLFRTPFSRNPRIERDAQPVQQLGDLQPPFVELVIDIRFDPKLLEILIRDRIGRAREKWKEGSQYRMRDRVVRELEKWLLLYKETTMKKRTVADYAREQGYEKNLSVLYKALKKATEFVEGRGYEGILSFLNARELDDLSIATAPWPFGKYREAPLTAEVVQGKR